LSVRVSPARRLAYFLAVSAIVAASAGDARANGRFPAAQQIAVPPNDPNLLVMMATFGVNWTHDNGANWDWTCEGAVGYQSNENPVLGVTQSDAVVIGAFEGIGVTTDQGCTWTLPTGGVSDPLTDLVVEKSDPHSVLFLSSGYLGQDDAGSTFMSRLWVTHDDAKTIAQLGPNLDPEILPETIDVAPSDATRVYLSGTRRVNGLAVGVLMASKDGGMTFASTTIPFPTSPTADGGVTQLDRAPYIAAVDPTNPDRVYIRVENIQGTRLLVSDDGLQTTRQVWQATGDLLGFALSADGTKVYAGGPNDGLHVASSTALDFTKQMSTVQIQCLALDGARLLACSDEASGFTVGATTDDGATWTALLHLSCMRGPLLCDQSSQVTVQCDPLWPAQQNTLGGPSATCGVDGGASDAGADAGSSSGGGGSSGGSSGGCALSARDATRATPVFGGAVGVGLFAMAWRRRRAKKKS
jgi:hypothetical protein